MQTPLRQPRSCPSSDHEGQRDRPWSVTDAPAPYIDGQLRGIVGIELAVTGVEGKSKPSQNRSIADRRGVVAGLHAEGLAGGRGVADAMAASLERDGHPGPPQDPTFDQPHG